MVGGIMGAVKTDPHVQLLFFPKQITLNIDNATTALDSSYPYDIFAVIGKSSVHGDSNPSLTLKSGNSGFS